MSMAILKKSLEIVDEDESKKKQKRKIQRKNCNFFDFEDDDRVS